MNFIEKLETLMSERDINRSELAQRSGIPYTTIMSFWDKGYDGVRLSTLRKLAAYFNCTIDYLADDHIATRTKPFSINDLTPTEIKMVETYMNASHSDRAIVRNLAKTIDRLLGLDGQSNE